MKRFKFFILFVLVLLFFLTGSFLIYQDSSNKYSKYIKDNTPVSIKDLFKKTIFYVPYSKREIKRLNSIVRELSEENNILNLENVRYKNLENIGKFKKEIFEFIDYRFNSIVLPFHDPKDIYGNKKSGYIENYENKLIITFTSGKIIFLDKKKLLEGKILDYTEINNNIRYNFFDQKIKWTGVKDIIIVDKYLYISLTKKVKKNCYNTSLYKAVLNKSYLNFTKVFEPDECFDLNRNIEAFRYFNGYQTGGRIEHDNENIYLSLGDYNYWKEPQDFNSFAGKIIALKKSNNKITLISLGHRNPQGMLYLKEKNSLIITEHGPKGGDEINLIKLNDNKVRNYGWPISSYGNHYDVVPINNYTKRYAPLYKIHSSYGFEEPIKYFEESIGISQIMKKYQEKNVYFVTSLKDNSIYEIEFDQNFSFRRIINRLNIKERIRDIIYDKDNKCYFLYGETTPKLIYTCDNNK